ncbi:MAG: hypothetical protein R2843_15705 [Thermomicrobiales bacterium]
MSSISRLGSGFRLSGSNSSLQQWAIDAGIIDFFNSYYRFFKPMLYVSAGVCTCARTSAFRRIRRIFLLTTLIAFPMYALYLLALLRSMTEFGYPSSIRSRSRKGSPRPRWAPIRQPVRGHAEHAHRADHDRRALDCRRASCGNGSGP